MFIFSFLFECFNLIFNFFSSAQVKDIGFTGVFRLIFRPLVDEFPCFGAVCCSLRQKVLYLLLKPSLILEIGKLYAHIYHIKREFDGNADVHQCRHVHASSLDTHMQIFNDGSGQVSCLWVIYSAQQFVIWIFFFSVFGGRGIWRIVFGSVLISYYRLKEISFFLFSPNLTEVYAHTPTSNT